MTKGTGIKSVVLITRIDASDDWLFVVDKRTKRWKLPIFRLWPWNNPMRKAVDASIKLLGNLTNIELSFELTGENCTVIVFTTRLEFILNIYPSPGLKGWMTPLDFMKLPENKKDSLSCDIISTITKALTIIDKEHNGKQGSKSNPLTVKLDDDN